MADGTWIDGRIDSRGDSDVFQVQPRGTLPLQFTLTTRHQGLLVPTITIYDSNGQIVQATTSETITADGTRTLTVVLHPLAGESYKLVVSDPSNTHVGTYRLECKTW